MFDDLQIQNCIDPHIHKKTTIHVENTFEAAIPKINQKKVYISYEVERIIKSEVVWYGSKM